MASSRRHNAEVELSGYGGVIFRGNPDSYTLTNGFRWGIGAGFPQRVKPSGVLVTAELFGESYFNKTITAPAGLIGAGRLVGADLDQPQEPGHLRAWCDVAGRQRVLHRGRRELEPHAERPRAMPRRSQA